MSGADQWTEHHEGEVLHQALAVLDALDDRLQAAAVVADPDGSYAIPLPGGLVSNWPVGTLFRLALQDDGRNYSLVAIPPGAPADDAPIPAPTYRLDQLDDGRLVLQPVLPSAPPQ